VAYFSSQPGSGGAPYSILIQPAGGGTAKPLSSFVIKADFFFRPTLDWSPGGEKLLTIQLENGQWQPIIINQTEDRIEGAVQRQAPQYTPAGLTTTNALHTV
jgi:hypothetical protein